MPEFNQKNIEKAARQLRLRLLVNRKRLHAPALRPHTWIFLRQAGNEKEPVICLGIVFHVWPIQKYNMVRFTAHTNTGKDVKTSGRLTKLDNGGDGMVLDVRWPWMTLLKEFKGLSAGNI